MENVVQALVMNRSFWRQIININLLTGAKISAVARRGSWTVDTQFANGNIKSICLIFGQLMSRNLSCSSIPMTPQRWRWMDA